MKKLILSAAFILSTTLLASAQVLPSFQFGLKGGVNLSQFTKYNTLSSDNRAGYLLGAYARIGALGFNFQPELYYASKSTNVSDGTTTNTITFNSIDVPLLIGYKVGAVGVGARIYTGPMASFILGNDQTVTSALGNIFQFKYKDQNYAWQFGAGVDIFKLSVDLRYEKGLTNLSNNGYDQKLNPFNLTLGYKLF